MAQSLQLHLCGHLLIVLSFLNHLLHCYHKEDLLSPTSSPERIPYQSRRNLAVIYSALCSCFLSALYLTTLPESPIHRAKQKLITCQSKQILFYVKEFSLLLSAANVCSGPIIYFFLCQPFREVCVSKLHIPLKTQHDSETSKTKRENIIQESTDTL